MQTKVLILYLGGTIGMQLDQTSGMLCPGNFEQLVANLPLLRDIDIPDRFTSTDVKNIASANRNKPHQDKKLFVEVNDNIILVDHAPFVRPFDSAQITTDHWLQTASTIMNAYDSYDGFVVLHGTDTMAYTASALSFMFANLAKPIVLTGAQLPVFNPRSDGAVNLLNALCVAGWRASGLPCIPEVTIAFADKLLRGCRSTKIDSKGLCAFSSPNCRPLGNFGSDIKLHSRSALSVDKDKPCSLRKAMEKNIICITLIPGQEDLQLAVLRDTQAQGCVLQVYGSGNMAYSKNIEKILVQANRRGVCLLVRSQCASGGVNLSHYQASKSLIQAGAISASDMTLEAASTKLMWALANCQSQEELHAYLLANQRGELS